MGVRFEDVPVPAPLRTSELPRVRPKLIARASIRHHALGSVA
jgi:hypothetical protein